MQFTCGIPTAELLATMTAQVRLALEEDAVDRDISTPALPDKTVCASVMSHDPGTLCGTLWFDEVFAQIDPAITIHWLVDDGKAITSKQKICTATGNAKNLLRGERCALNFLQSLSATSTAANAFVQRVKEARAQKQVDLMDTRKTLPGLRLAQKYAAACGGFVNHRHGLSDGILLKENHLIAYGSIETAVKAIRKQSPGVPIEVETENLEEVRTAMAMNVEKIMLDNFSLPDIHNAVALINQQTRIEVSGNVSLDNIAEIAQTGVDCISIGTITKHIHALDMSMRFN